MTTTTKIIRSGLQVRCDRSGKTEPVTDPELVKFYEDFLENKAPGDVMFAAVMATPKGPRRVTYEVLGPKSLDAVGKYMNKIDPKGEDAGGGGDDEPGAEAPSEPAAEAPAEEKPRARKAKTKPAAEPPPPPPPEADDEEDDGQDFSEDEMFEDD